MPGSSSISTHTGHSCASRHSAPCGGGRGNGCFSPDLLATRLSHRATRPGCSKVRHPSLVRRARRFRGVAVITSASHAEGPRFDPGRNHNVRLFCRGAAMSDRANAAVSPTTSKGGGCRRGGTLPWRLRGATVARLTPDQKVACSNHVGVMGALFWPAKTLQAIHPFACYCRPGRCLPR